MKWFKRLIVAAAARPARVHESCDSCYEDERDADFMAYEYRPEWHNGWGTAPDYSFPDLFNDDCDVSSPDICWSAPTI